MFYVLVCCNFQEAVFQEAVFQEAVLKVFLEGAFAKRPYIIHSKSN